MVLSRINENVSYPELKTVDAEDKNYESELYEIEVLGVDIVIALGLPKNSLADYGITFFPLYFVRSNNKVTKIGVFEIQTTNMLDLKEFENFDEPLIYTFVTADYLKQHRMLPPAEAAAEIATKSPKALEKISPQISAPPPPPIKIPHQRADIFLLNSAITPPPPLHEETAKQAQDAREKYHESDEDVWMQKFMKNKGYSIVDNEGAGDCLFATIRDAFASIGQETTVTKLRNKLSNEVDTNVFRAYKDRYDMLVNSQKAITEQSKKLRAEYSKLQENLGQTIDLVQKQQIKRAGDDIKRQHDELKPQLAVTKELLSEVLFMKNIATIEDFKGAVKTCEFWADEWAISTLERALNIKLVIFDSERYRAGEYAGVLSCGGTIDPILESRGEFEPDVYLMVEHTTNHYKLIGYRQHLAFSFKELPRDVKTMIVDKCMERNAGIYSMISDFEKFKSELGRIEPPVFDTIDEGKLRHYYDDNIVLTFYDKSADAKAGKGSGDKVPPELMKEFAALSAIPNWRRKLDNLWVQPFMLEGKRWQSVEHFYQGSKFRKTHPDYFAQFALDSDSEISKSPDMAKGAGGKNGKFEGKRIRPKDIEMDTDFFPKRAEDELYHAQKAKFTQNEELKKLLIATNNAKLQQYRRGREPEIYTTLMRLRAELVAPDVAI